MGREPFKGQALSGLGPFTQMASDDQPSLAVARGIAKQGQDVRLNGAQPKPFDLAANGIGLSGNGTVQPVEKPTFDLPEAEPPAPAPHTLSI